MKCFESLPQILSRTCTQIRVVGASVAGSRHQSAFLPCQDAWGFRGLGAGTAAIAVADGLGSAEKSQMGASAAVAAALEQIASAVRDGEGGLLIGSSPSDSPGRSEYHMSCLEQTVMDGLLAARRDLERLADGSDEELRALSTTLMVAIVSRDLCVSAHIGDGGAVAKIGDSGQGESAREKVDLKGSADTDGGERVGSVAGASVPPDAADSFNGLRVLSPPEEGEYANEVVPLTAPDYKAHIRVSSLSGPVDALALFTDGCQWAVLAPASDGLVPFGRFLTPLFEFLRQQQDTERSEVELRKLLASPRMTEHSDDDKTLVVAILSESAEGESACTP